MMKRDDANNKEAKPKHEGALTAQFKCNVNCTKCKHMHMSLLYCSCMPFMCSGVCASSCALQMASNAKPKAAAEKAAADKAAADKAALDKAAAEKAASDKATGEKAAADKAASSSR